MPPPRKPSAAGCAGGGSRSGWRFARARCGAGEGYRIGAAAGCCSCVLDKAVAMERGVALFVWMTSHLAALRGRIACVRLQLPCWLLAAKR